MAVLSLKGNTTASYLVNLNTRGHQFNADASAADNGTDMAPSPKDMFLASVAGCKLITMKMYVDRKGWEVRDIKIELEFDTSNTEAYTILQKITVDADLEENQIQRIKNIAEKCPVAKYMKQGVIFGEL